MRLRDVAARMGQGAGLSGPGAVVIIALLLGAASGVVLASACGSGARDDAFRAGYRAGFMARDKGPDV